MSSLAFVFREIGPNCARAASTVLKLDDFAAPPELTASPNAGSAGNSTFHEKTPCGRLVALTTPSRTSNRSPSFDHRAVVCAARRLYH
jgi:hypothetical protein